MALVEVINQAQAERAAARSELDCAPVADTLSEDEIRAMINSLGMLAPSCRIQPVSGISTRRLTCKFLTIQPPTRPM